jgi:hypothetical protein
LLREAYFHSKNNQCAMCIHYQRVARFNTRMFISLGLMPDHDRKIQKDPLTASAVYPACRLNVVYVRHLSDQMSDS